MRSNGYQQVDNRTPSFSRLFMSKLHHYLASNKNKATNKCTSIFLFEWSCHLIRNNKQWPSAENIL